MNIMESDLQSFIDRQSVLSLLNFVQLSIEVVVGNYVAITFSRVKSKPDKSKHHFKNGFLVSKETVVPFVRANDKG